MEPTLGKIEKDLDEGVWTIPAEKFKTGDEMEVPLVPEAIEILTRRQNDNGSEWVFPGPGKTGHLVDPTKIWERILERAEITNLRIHDLRRTLGSWQARAGASLYVIGRTLGHKNPQTTAIYARLDLDPVRLAVKAATDAMMATAKAKDRTDGEA